MSGAGAFAPVLLLQLLVSPALVFGAPAADEVTSLPGWDGPLPSRQFSGYIRNQAQGVEQNVHYWFVESENDPSSDPLLVWYNGGPGASSVFGYLTELGPFNMNDASFVNRTIPPEAPQLFHNPYGYQKIANLLFTDAPAPVGFSYCGASVPPGTGKSGCPVWNDTTAGVENRNLLATWLSALFPEFIGRPLFIAGESYAGVYIPEIVKAIMANPGPIRLEGFAVGNGCLGFASLGGCGLDDDWTNLLFLHNHAMISNAMFEFVIANCTEQALRDGKSASMPGCPEALEKMETEAGGYYEYDIYDECSAVGDKATQQPARSLRARHRAGATLPKPSGGDYSCGSTRGYFTYVNVTSVRTALHVPESMYFMDADGTWHGYNMSERDLTPWFRHIMQLPAPPRVLVYSGDVDSSVNEIGTEEFTEGLGLKEVHEWRPWTLDGARAMGGYVTRYHGSTGGQLDFLTVRGSGHMVPQMRPQAGLEMMTRWLRNEPWRPYNATASKDVLESMARHANAEAATRVEEQLEYERVQWLAREAVLRQRIQRLKGQAQDD